MEMTEIRDRVLQHDLSIQNFDTWAQSAEKRLNELEKSRDLMGDIKVALAELKMSNTQLTEKFKELKEAMEGVIKDNREQHKELSKRIEELEDKPARSWDRFVWLLVTGVVGVIIGYFANLFN